MAVSPRGTGKCVAGLQRPGGPSGGDPGVAHPVGLRPHASFHSVLLKTTWSHGTTQTKRIPDVPRPAPGSVL